MPQCHPWPPIEIDQTLTQTFHAAVGPQSTVHGITGIIFSGDQLPHLAQNGGVISICTSGYLQNHRQITCECIYIYRCMCIHVYTYVYMYVYVYTYQVDCTHLVGTPDKGQGLATALLSLVHFLRIQRCCSIDGWHRCGALRRWESGRIVPRMAVPSGNGKTMGNPQENRKTIVKSTLWLTNIAIESGWLIIDVTNKDCDFPYLC